ncbi:hypothetical protein CHS0354_033076 [Potamilus streckersoni]|uniref:L-xylulose reductase n=1 Tax=Potamilus streckersoni TaxID=2493646 RepID=A0AAE0TAC9_9BIVA|nr:hypothetical protein CHS0354_033076 [Potamilus streckersoni]
MGIRVSKQVKMASNSRFAGKTALVTGAGKGIGKGVAEALLKHGARVIALDIVEEYLQSLKKKYPEITTVQVNLGDWKATKQAIESLPTVDLLVNNAGVLKMCSILETTEEDINLLLDVNLKAYLNVAQVVARKLIAEKRSGTFVNVASIAANKPLEQRGAYCISKQGVQMLTEALACELGPHGIRVNGINPGIINTDMIEALGEKRIRLATERTPLRRLGEVCDVVDAILFLLGDESSYMNGHSLVLDGGLLKNL